MTDTNSGFDIPIVLIAFNRPELTRKVFSEIRNIKPKKLFLVVDGPRPHKNGEELLCGEVRGILDHVDWECEVIRDYASSNMGCKNRIVSGLNNVFDQVEMAIILEDDCLPDHTFFPYCHELLLKYADNPRIGVVCGTSFSENTTPHYEDYYFSEFPKVWGWATWRRTWELYDPDLQEWHNSNKEEFVNGHTSSKEGAEHWVKLFDKVANNEIDTWDYQLVHSLWANNRLSITPFNNLISNIGFGEEATHTVNPFSPVAELAIQKVEFPLRHPPAINKNSKEDLRTESLFGRQSLKTAILIGAYRISKVLKIDAVLLRFSVYLAGVLRQVRKISRQ